jgi:hypothetical protein
MQQVGGTGKAPRHEHAWGREGIVRLDRGVLSASSPGLFTGEESPGTNWRLGALPSWSGRCGEENNILIQPGIEPGLLGRPARSPSLYRLSYRTEDESIQSFGRKT